MGRTEHNKIASVLLTSSALSKLDEVYTVLRKGTSLIKYGRQGNPKYHFFRVVDNTLVWESKGQKKTVMLSRVVDIQPGQKTSVFKKHRDQSLEHLSFSLVYKDDRSVTRTLDLVCTKEEVYQTWVVGLIKLIEEQHNQITEHKEERRRRSSFIVGDQVPNNGFEIPDNSPPECQLEEQTSVGTSSDKMPTPTFETPPGDLYVFGKLGNQWYSYPQQLEGSLKMDIKQAACSDRMAVIITRKGQVYTVGEDLGLHACSLQPRALQMASGFRAGFASCSGATAFLISSEDGTVRSWGLNQAGQLGPWNVRGVFHLRSVPSLYSIKQVSCSPSHVACISEEGEILTWGDGYGGKLGHGNGDSIQAPKVVEKLSGVVGKWISCGHFHTCVVGSQGELYSWGGDFGSGGAIKKNHHKGCLGNGSMHGTNVPVKVNIKGSSDLGMREVCCGEHFSIALDEEGWVYQCGSMGVQSGTRDAPWEGAKVFTKVLGLLADMRVDKLCCGDGHVAVIASRVGMDANTEGPLLLTWGRGQSGQLGVGVVHDGIASPTIVEDLRGERLRNVVCGGDVTMVIIDYNQNSAVIKASQQSAASVRRAISRTKMHHLSVAIPQNEFEYRTPSTTPTPSTLIRPSSFLTSKPTPTRRKTYWTSNFLTTSSWRSSTPASKVRRPLEDDIERSVNSYTSAYDEVANRQSAEVHFHSEHGSRIPGNTYNRQVWSMSPVSTTTPSPQEGGAPKGPFRQRSLTPPATIDTLQKIDLQPQKDEVDSDEDDEFTPRVDSPSAKSDSYAIPSVYPTTMTTAALMSAANAVFPSLDLSACTFRRSSQEIMSRVTSLNPCYSDVDFSVDMYSSRQFQGGDHATVGIEEQDEEQELQKQHLGRSQDWQAEEQPNDDQLLKYKDLVKDLSVELSNANAQIVYLMQKMKQQKWEENNHMSQMQQSLIYLEGLVSQKKQQQQQQQQQQKPVLAMHRRSYTQDSWSQVDFNSSLPEQPVNHLNITKYHPIQERADLSEVEVEKGVFITMKAGDVEGGNQLVRLRFSKSWKSRQRDVDQWWRQNRDKIMQVYNIVGQGYAPAAAATASQQQTNNNFQKLT